MVGFTIKKAGTLDTKQPSTATIGRGWRYQAWKIRRVELVDNGDKTAELRLYKDEELIQVVALENIKEVRDVASKTHAHAFEIVDSNNKAIIILSGETALESKDWIWAIRKIFWPVQDAGILDKVLVRLLGSEETEQLGFSDGEYQFTVSISGLYVTMPTASGARDNEGEPTKNGGKRSGFSLPLTTIGKVTLETGFTNYVSVETTPDSKCGAVCFRFESVNEQTTSTASLYEGIKTAVLKATNHLHDCIDNSDWKTS